MQSLGCAFRRANKFVGSFAAARPHGRNGWARCPAASDRWRWRSVARAQARVAVEPCRRRLGGSRWRPRSLPGCGRAFSGRPAHLPDANRLILRSPECFYSCEFSLEKLRTGVSNSAPERSEKDRNMSQKCRDLEW